MLKITKRAHVLFLIALTVMLSSLVSPWSEAMKGGGVAVAASAGLSKNGTRFTYNGSPIYLNGLSGAYALVDLSGYNYQQFIDTIASQGKANYFRIFLFWPNDDRLSSHISPWARSSTPGAADGRNKYNLNSWDPNYFNRLKAIISYASSKGVMVELTLFDHCQARTPDGSTSWKYHPFNPSNNIQNVGLSWPNSTGNGVDWVKEGNKVESYQEAFVRKIIDEVNPYDNLFFEIANEVNNSKLSGGTGGGAFTKHFVNFVKSYEASKPKQHLLAVNDFLFSDYDPNSDPAVDIVNIHTITQSRSPWPALNNSLTQYDAINANLKGRAAKGKIANYDEPYGSSASDMSTYASNYRKQLWSATVAGGMMNLLDTSFAPWAGGSSSGSGGETVRAYFKLNKSFIDTIGFSQMSPNDGVVVSAPSGVTTHALVNAGKEYLVYLRDGSGGNVTLNLASGTYNAKWYNPKDGTYPKTQSAIAGGGNVTLSSPSYSSDIVLYLKSTTSAPAPTPAPTTPPPPSPTPAPSGSLSSFLPVILDNAYGGWSTGISIQNTSGSPSFVTIDYFDSSGRLKTRDSFSVASHDYLAVSQAGHLGSGFAGSAIVHSNQPLAIAVNEVSSKGQAMSYRGSDQSSNTLYAPVVLSNAYGGWSTGLSIQNTSSSSASVTINYFNSNGSKVKQQSQTIPPKGSWAVYQGGLLPNGFAGSAVINSNQAIVAIVNETSPSSDAMSYNALRSGNTAHYLPEIHDNASGWTTGISIQNTSSNPTSVSIDYYDANGRKVATDSHTIPTKGYWGAYQGGRLGQGFAGSAVVNSNQDTTVLVNDISPSKGARNYDGYGTTATINYLPAILNNAYGGWTTSISLQNASANSSNIAIKYYDTNGKLVNQQTKTLAGRGSWTVSQGASGLPSGFTGSAIISSSQSSVAIADEIKPTSSTGSAMSYNAITP